MKKRKHILFGELRQRIALWWFFKVVNITDKHLSRVLERRICDRAGEWHAGIDTAEHEYSHMHFVRVPKSCVEWSMKADRVWGGGDCVWAFFYGHSHLSALARCYSALRRPLGSEE